jgi:predicted alpha/beta-fold hydrolase
VLDVDLPAYRPPRLLRSGHVQTVLPSLFRRVSGVDYRRERLDLPDGDFLDVDWAFEANGSSAGDGRQRVAILAHGLEGSTHRAYIRGMARALGQRGWTTCAWNMRGCSGEPNRTLRATHSGATEDLDAVVGHVLGGGPSAVALVGFSLGGNVTLKWLGERGGEVGDRVVGAAALSVPIDLASASETMARWSRRIYMRRFIRSLAAKAEEKAARFPDAPDPTPVSAMTSFRAFDDHVTAPVHGFESAEDYWRRSSAGPLLPEIRVPTLLVQALDDPFLAPSCYPHAVAETNPHLKLLTPSAGGHVGFVAPGGEYWSETVVGRFLDAALADAPYAETSSASRSAPPSTA